jgi:hypothetical protein
LTHFVNWLTINKLTVWLKEAKGDARVDFDLPQEITDKLAELDAFIETEIKPLERAKNQAARAREYAVLRPPARARSDGLGPRRATADGMARTDL